MKQNTPPLALLLNCYGTILEDDGALLKNVCEQISGASPLAATTADVISYWGRLFGQLCAQSFGTSYRTQREIVRVSLGDALEHFQVSLDSEDISESLFEHWRRPPIFPEIKEVLAQCRVPLCLVSNIDNAEVQSALQHNGLSFDWVVTSEDCRAYKPRGDMFQKALSLLHLSAHEVLHAGDSFGSDVRGAKSQGIPVLWVNRKGRQPPPDDRAPDYVAADLRGLLDIL